MAEDALEYEVRLRDQMSGPAHDAADSLQKLKERATDAKGGLAELTGGFLKVVEPAEVMKDAFREVAAGVGDMISGIKGGSAEEVVKGLADSLAGLATLLDLVVPGLGQAAAAIIRFGGAIASATVGVVQEAMSMAIEATQAKDAMVSMFGALAGSAAEGAKIEEMLGDLSEQIGVTKDALAPFTRAFMAMGVEGEDALKRLTLAAASAQAIMGDPAAAHAFENLEKKIHVAVQTGQGLKIPAKGLGSLADMGIRVDDVAKRMGLSTATLSSQLKAGSVNAAKFGAALEESLIEKGAGPLARMSASFDNLKKMAGQSIEDMFEGMSKDVDPFMAQIKDLFGVFSQSKPSGQAMKAGIGGALHQIFAVMTPLIPKVKHFFLNVVIWSLQAYIAIKKNWTSIRPIFEAVGWVVGVSANAFASLTHGIFMAIGAAANLAGEIKAGIDRVGKFADVLYIAGTQLVDGFIGGIKAGVSRVADAASDLATSAKDAVKGVLGIHSPSRVTMQLGAHVSAGLAGGMSAHAGHVERAAAGVGARAVTGMNLGAWAPALPARGGAATQGAGMNVGGVTIQITAPNGVTNATELTEAAIVALFDRLALQRGLG